MFKRSNSCIYIIFTFYFHCNHVVGVCLPSQSATRNHNQEKKPTNLCAPRKFIKKMCLPRLIIMHRINKPFACSRCLICVSCSVQLISTYYVCKGSWTFYLYYPQINEVGKSELTTLKTFEDAQRSE